MSIPVTLDDLPLTLSQFGFAYLMVGNGDRAPRVVAVTPVHEDGVLTVRSVGTRTRQNMTVNPNVALVWPPTAPNGYSLICDGTAAVDDQAVRITPTHAVLHRPASSAQPASPGG